jgi:DNA-binding CsgD family transcriptional regulator
MTPEEKAKKAMAQTILAMTKKGKTAQTIADELGCSTMTIVGIKAAISRGVYGKAGQTFMQKRKAKNQSKPKSKAKPKSKGKGQKAAVKDRKAHVDKTKAKAYAMIEKGKTNDQIMKKLKIAGPSIAALRAVVSRRKKTSPA